MMKLRRREGVGSSARSGPEDLLFELFVSLDGPAFAGREISGVQVELTRAIPTRTGNTLPRDIAGGLRILGRRPNQDHAAAPDLAAAVLGPARR